MLKLHNWSNWRDNQLFIFQQRRRDPPLEENASKSWLPVHVLNRLWLGPPLTIVLLPEPDPIVVESTDGTMFGHQLIGPCESMKRTAVNPYLLTCFSEMTIHSLQNLSWSSDQICPRYSDLWISVHTLSTKRSSYWLQLCVDYFWESDPRSSMNFKFARTNGGSRDQFVPECSRKVQRDWEYWQSIMFLSEKLQRILSKDRGLSRAA